MNLELKGKHFLLCGAANKKSLTSVVAEMLKESGAKLTFSVQGEEQKQTIERLFPDHSLYCCNFAEEDQVVALGQEFTTKQITFDGILHSLAFADFSNGKNILQASRQKLLEAYQISALSLVELVKNLKGSLNPHASIVTVSISDLFATSYGFLGPIKAALEHQVAYLAKELSLEGKDLRVNAVAPGPLKTSASAGIPGFIDHYLFSEKLSLRKRNLETKEVAQAILFLLSPLSSGINATSLRVDGGMKVNGFDEEIVAATIRE